MSAASSGVALGMTPGSLKLVLNRVDMTNMNSAPPTAGIAGVTLTAKYGQLKREKMIVLKSGIEALLNYLIDYK